MKINPGVAGLIFYIPIILYISFVIGSRELGFDYEEYVFMFDRYISSRSQGDTFLESLYIVKDPLIAVLIEASSFFGGGEVLIFTLIAFVSLLTKLFAVKVLASEKIFLFFIFYLILLMPGLEYAAIRSALGIGFLMLALSYYDKKIFVSLFSILAVLSHISMVIPLLFILRPVRFFLLKHRLISFLIILFIIAFFSTGVLLLFPQGYQYTENPGTINAYAPPLLSLFIYYLVFSGSKFLNNDTVDFRINAVVLGLIYSSFAFVHDSVTISTRLLEVAYVLILVFTLRQLRFNLDFISDKGKFVISLNAVGLMVFLLYLVYLNIYRGTWSVFLGPDLI